jgi:hypothetical protein
MYLFSGVDIRVGYTTVYIELYIKFEKINR